jgi:hypothetical protein
MGRIPNVGQINCSVDESGGKFTAVFTAGVYSPNSLWRGIIKLFPARESLYVTSRLGTGKPQTFFYSAETGGGGRGRGASGTVLAGNLSAEPSVLTKKIV